MARSGGMNFAANKKEKEEREEKEMEKEIKKNPRETRYTNSGPA